MATVTAAITLTSTDLLSNALSFSVSSSITATHSTGLARAPITSVAKGTGSGQVTLYTADDYAATAYVYIKNTDTISTDYVYVYADTSSDDPVLLKLSGGEWAFLPTNADATLKAYAATSGTVVEWMVVGTDQ
jgi:hypothetical protein|tara:strand:+ start:611 stop:1009 length:399 start_codon:yes stop_codon:yes gene_type:complete